MTVAPLFATMLSLKIYTGIYSFAGNIFFHDKILILKHLRAAMKGNKNCGFMKPMTIRAKLIKIMLTSTVNKR